MKSGVKLLLAAAILPYKASLEPSKVHSKLGALINELKWFVTPCTLAPHNHNCTPPPPLHQTDPAVIIPNFYRQQTALIVFTAGCKCCSAQWRFCFSLNMNIFKICLFNAWFYIIAVWFFKIFLPFPYIWCCIASCNRTAPDLELHVVCAVQCTSLGSLEQSGGILGAAISATHLHRNTHFCTELGGVKSL